MDFVLQKGVHVIPVEVKRGVNTRSKSINIFASKRLNIFGESIEWLHLAGTVLKCQKITEGNIPIAVYAYFPDFKLYMSDVGLLALKSRLPAELLVAENNEYNSFMGFVTENYVAQAFTANKIPLFYSQKNFGFENGIKSVPLYAVFCIWKTALRC